MIKRIFCFVVIVTMVLAISPVFMITARAATAKITDPSDPRIEEMLALIDNQNFSSTKRTAAEVKEIIRHFIFDSTFAGIGSGRYPHPNRGSYTTSIKDNVYSSSVRGSKGCMSYAYFLSMVIYGQLGARLGEQRYTEATLRTFLLTYAQAGDHLRISGRHSLAVISCNNDGFYTLDYAGDSTQGINLCYWSYAEFARSYSRYSLYLYDANPSKNDGTIQPYQPPELTPEEEDRYLDVSKSDWFYDSVMFVYEYDLMIGIDGDRFAPNETLTREQAIQIIARLSGSEYAVYEEQASFDDIDPLRWSAAAIAWAKDTGVTKGVDAKTFDPEGIVTMDQFEVMLMRHFKLEEMWLGNTIPCSRMYAAFLLYDYIANFD